MPYGNSTHPHADVFRAPYDIFFRRFDPYEAIQLAEIFPHMVGNKVLRVWLCFGVDRSDDFPHWLSLEPLRGVSVLFKGKDFESFEVECGENLIGETAKATFERSLRREIGKTRDRMWKVRVTETATRAMVRHWWGVQWNSVFRRA
jgi:hypothetical protein